MGNWHGEWEVGISVFREARTRPESHWENRSITFQNHGSLSSPKLPTQCLNVRSSMVKWHKKIQFIWGLQPGLRRTWPDFLSAGNAKLPEEPEMSLGGSLGTRCVGGFPTTYTEMQKQINHRTIERNTWGDTGSYWGWCRGSPPGPALCQLPVSKAGHILLGRASEGCGSVCYPYSRMPETDTIHF